jgi:hypothetical protein
MAQQPRAAGALYPHLKSGTPERRPERNQSIGQAMWPTLGPQPQPPINPARENLLRNLRELNSRLQKGKP